MIACSVEARLVVRVVKVDEVDDREILMWSGTTSISPCLHVASIHRPLELPRGSVDFGELDKPYVEEAKLTQVSIPTL